MLPLFTSPIHKFSAWPKFTEVWIRWYGVQTQLLYWAYLCSICHPLELVHSWWWRGRRRKTYKKEKKIPTNVHFQRCYGVAREWNKLLKGLDDLFCWSYVLHRNARGKFNLVRSVGRVDMSEIHMLESLLVKIVASSPFNNIFKWTNIFAIFSKIRVLILFVI